MKIKTVHYFLSFLLIASGVGLSYQSCSTNRIPLSYLTDTLEINSLAKGNEVEIIFTRGVEHNHPLMAIWITDTKDNYIQTLYVAESIAKGVFGHGDKSSGMWAPGPIRRPAALPVWAHSRGVQEKDGLYVPTEQTQISDAYTGATPPSNFVLKTNTDSKLPEKFIIYFEINQTWDWNRYWTNNKYPNDSNYKTSCQPALVYKTKYSMSEKGQVKLLQLTGHSHFNGSDGNITNDLSTITTARDITEEISFKLLHKDQ